MKMVNVHTAKTQLSQLLAEVEAGEEVVIARNGTPVARLIRYVTQEMRPAPGFGADTVQFVGEIPVGPVFEPSDYADPDLWSDD